MITGQSISDQLKPLAERTFKRVPRLVPVMQVTADLAGEDKGAAVAEARLQALRWIQKRTDRLPEQAWKHEDFTLDHPATPAAAVTLRRGEVDYWIGRLSHPDNDVAGRVWTTEITVAHDPNRNRARFGLRLTVATRELVPNFQSGIPGVVRQVVEAPGLLRHERRVSDTPWVITSEDEVDELISLIEDERRRRPIYVVSLDEDEADPAKAIIDPGRLAQNTVGLAHVVVLPGLYSYALTDQVGTRFSVFKGAVRKYRPGCDLITDSPFNHPLAMKEAILVWGSRGPEEFLELLIQRAASDSLARTDVESELPSFSHVRKEAMRLQKEALQARVQSTESSGRSDAELIELLELENAELTKDGEDWEALAQSEQEAREEETARREEKETENYWLRERVRQLESETEQIIGSSIGDQVPIPESLNQLREWTGRHIVGRIFVTGKALRAAKNSPFTDVRLAYKAVLLLANEYRQMHVESTDENKQAFERKLAGLGLENARSGDETRLREEGDEFLVPWGKGKQLLTWHLKNGGNTRDPTRCFRLYYFWDDESQQVVIGSMPGHLHTRAT